MAKKSLEAHFIECLEKGNTKKAKYITQLFGDDVNKLYKGKSLLVWAKEFENEEVIKALEEKGAVDEVISIKEATRLGRELIEASKFGEVEKVVELIENGADVNIKDKYGYTALLHASNNGYKELVEKLIENGADVNIKDKYGKTALMYASSKGYKELVEKLLESGADVNLRDENGWTALIEASLSLKKNAYNITEMLIKAGADVNIRTKKGSSALICAVSRDCCQDIAKLLIENGADVYKKDKDGMNAIQAAIDDEMRWAIVDSLKKRLIKKVDLEGKIKRFLGRGE